MIPLTNAQRCAEFGKFDWVPGYLNDGSIVIDPNWVARNIVRVDRRLDRNCRLVRVLNGRAIRLHRAAADSFIALIMDWEQAGLLQYIHTWDGSFVPRYKRGATGKGMAALSNHSWGTAFDINAREYPLGKPAPSASPMPMLAAIAAERNWFWGGNFRHRPDPMHFEFCG